MSEQKNAKSETDLSSNSSWSVIDKSDESRRSSVENILEYDSDNLNSVPSKREIGKEVEDTFIDIPEESTNIVVDELKHEESFCFDEFQDDKNKEVTSGKSKTKRRKKPKAEPLSILSIAASVLTITGLTLLCMLFPQNIEDDTLNQVEANYISVVTSDNPNFSEFINKTTETFNVVNETNLLQKITDSLKDENFVDDTMCPDNEQEQYTNDSIIQIDTIGPSPLNPVLPIEIEDFDKYDIESEEIDETNLVNSFQKLQNKTMGLIKDLEKVLMNPNLQIFLCTLMQDICLIKLVKQLNKPQVQKVPSDPPKSADIKKLNPEKQKGKKGKKATPLKRKLEGKLKEVKHKNKESSDITEEPKTGKKVGDSISQQIFISSVNAVVRPDSPILIDKLNNHFRAREDVRHGRENGKSECERRFEELDNKWEVAGHNHRQNVQEIKENFKNEVLHIKEQEKELSQRKKRISLIREKYIDRLKLDREKYLYQLRKLRDEHHRIMRELCLKKNKDIDLKDASVGNYAVLLPDTYSFQQRLQLLRNRENKSKVNLPVHPPASYPKLNPVAITPGNFTGYQSFPNITDQKSKKGNNKTLNLVQVKREKYMEKVKKYYDRKEKYLKKKAAGLSKISLSRQSPTKVENFTDNPFEDMISHMIATISESKSQCYKSFSNSSIETVKVNSTKGDVPLNKTEDVEVSDQNISDNHEPISINSEEFKPVVRRRQRKPDLYDAAFDGHSKKIKRDDMMKWNNEKKNKTVHQPVLSKQDPQKSYKEKVIIKGHL